jgi:hypothetical protein
MRTVMRTLTSTVFIAAAAGFVFAHYGGGGSSSSPPPLTAHVAAANFSVSYPSNWRRTTLPGQPDVRLQGAVALAGASPAGAELVLGTNRAPEPSNLPAGALPAHLRAALPAAPRPQIVTLGSSSFYRYLDLAPTGENVSESIYLLPTTAGTITAVCSATQPSVPFTSSCERVLGTLRVTAGKIMSLTVDAGYAFQLNQILGALNAVRSATGKDLRSADARTRAAAAQRLAAADDRAARAAHHITTIEVSLANQPLEGALRMNAAAYRGLASAALRPDPVGYQRAEAAISRSERALQAVYAQLRTFGYKVG